MPYPYTEVENVRAALEALREEGCIVPGVLVSQREFTRIISKECLVDLYDVIPTRINQLHLDLSRCFGLGRELESRHYLVAYWVYNFMNYSRTFNKRRTLTIFQYLACLVENDDLRAAMFSLWEITFGIPLEGAVFRGPYSEALSLAFSRVFEWLDCLNLQGDPRFEHIWSKDLPEFFKSEKETNPNELPMVRSARSSKRFHKKCAQHAEK